jgi:hypothetical protein
MKSKNFSAKTAIITVQKPTRTLARKGVEQVGAVMSSERFSVHGCGGKRKCEFYSVILCISKKELSGLFYCKWTRRQCWIANKSGWMIRNDFLLFMEHFIEHITVTNYKPVLLLLDNHHTFPYEYFTLQKKLEWCYCFSHLTSLTNFKYERGPFMDLSNSLRTARLTHR